MDLFKPFNPIYNTLLLFLIFENDILVVDSGKNLTGYANYKHLIPITYISVILFS